MSHLANDATTSEPSTNPHERLKELITSGSLQLPLLPEASSRLLSMCNDSECDPRDLSETIRRDQSIAVHVLRIANSAMYSAGTPIVSLQQAVARLGMQRIREIVWIISCKGRVFDVKGFEPEVRSSFRHSLAVAAFAQEIARLRRLNVEDAFLCGLLHDIGRPVLLQAIVDLQNQEQVQFERTAVLAAVDELRVPTGGKLIDTWNLPKRVSETVGDQQLSDLNALSQDGRVLHLAIELTSWLLESEAHETDVLRAHPVVELLNIYPDQLEAILAKRDIILDWIGSAK